MENTNDTKEKDFQTILKPLFVNWKEGIRGRKDFFDELKRRAAEINIESYINCRGISTIDPTTKDFQDSKKTEESLDKKGVRVFHYGVLVYDNFDPDTSHNTLIPFKHVYSPDRKNPDGGLNARLGQSDSNFRDFLFNNEKNAEIIQKLGDQGYIWFEHKMDESLEKWNFDCYPTGKVAKRELVGVDQLWKSSNSVLRVFHKDIMEYNEVNNPGTIMYSCVKVIDVDVQGRSSSYLVVNTDSQRALIDFMNDSYRQMKLTRLVSAIRSLYTKIHCDLQWLEAVKSAKSAIMSRNVSHNLGSHVMAYLKQGLSSVSSVLSENNCVLPPSILKSISNNIELPFLVGLGRFLGYLQERQDYIATISTDYIPYGAPVNFKDTIYDELNPDLRYLRHKKNSNGDNNNKPANILLNYIAKSEGFSRENMTDEFRSKNDIRFGFIDYSTGQSRIFGLDTDNNEIRSQDDIRNFESNNGALTQMRKISFSLPGGLVGRQAFFSIIENLIRNAAKHGNTSDVKNLDFTLDVIDGSDLAYDLHLNENSSNNTKKVVDWEKRVYDSTWRKLYEKASISDLEDLYIMTITDNLTSDVRVIDNIKGGLYEDFVNPNTGRMTTANKGIKEIRISAAWLRGITNEDLYLKYPRKKDYSFNKNVDAKLDEYCVDNDLENTSKKLAPLVGVELSKDNHLRYIICLRKNKTVAIVSEVKLDDGTVIHFDKNHLELFRKLREKDKNCWSILSEGEIIRSKTSYSFILCPDDDRAFNELRPLTSNRLCRWKATDETESVLQKNSEDILIYIYQLYTSLNQESEAIFIDDGSAKCYSDILYRNEGKKWFKNVRFDAENINSGKPSYCYFTHLSTESNFKAFGDSYFDKEFDCVEGITGDNSSDRLIRREWLDEKWYYTHLYAMKKKVAIIDERIFKMVHSIDDNTFVDYSDDNITMEELIDIVGIEKIEMVKKAIMDNRKTLNLTDEDEKHIYFSNNVRDISNVIKCIPYRIVAHLPEVKKINKTVIGNSHLSRYYKGKGVDVYTVVVGVDGRMMLVGCIESVYDRNNHEFVNKFAKMATFRYNEEDDEKEKIPQVIPEEPYKSLFMGRYDYISIHQGILDKIYENLKIDKNNSIEKKELTSKIHKSLMKDPSVIGDFLPRFIIHSGRAKPAVEDMPQKQPFLQFAAIENAVKDCKPILVELLDFAKFEDD